MPHSTIFSCQSRRWQFQSHHTHCSCALVHWSIHLHDQPLGRIQRVNQWIRSDWKHTCDQCTRTCGQYEGLRGSRREGGRGVVAVPAVWVKKVKSSNERQCQQLRDKRVSGEEKSSKQEFWWFLLEWDSSSNLPFISLYINLFIAFFWAVMFFLFMLFSTKKKPQNLLLLLRNYISRPPNS